VSGSGPMSSRPGRGRFRAEGAKVNIEQSGPRSMSSRRARADVKSSGPEPMSSRAGLGRCHGPRLMLSRAGPGRC